MYQGKKQTGLCGKDSAGKDEVESERDEKIWIYKRDRHYGENRGGNDIR